MNRLENGIELDYDENIENLDLDLGWRLHESQNEFWLDDHPNSQFLFYCGPKEKNGDISKYAETNIYLSSIFPEYIFSAGFEPNLYIFFRWDAKDFLKKNLTFEDAVASLRSLMSDNEIQELCD